MHILVFGDSITYGAWDNEGGWTQRLRNFCDIMQMEKRMGDCLTYNLGVSGDTTQDVLKRFTGEMKNRLGDDKDFLVIFSIGSNDAEVVDKKTTRLTESECRKNIAELIKLAKKFSAKVVFTGLINVDEARTMPVPWKWGSHTIWYTNKAQKIYDSIIKDVCKKNKIHFIELYGKMKEEDLFDGVHPNAQGHEKIFSIVKDYLVKNSLIKVK